MPIGNESSDDYLKQSIEKLKKHWEEKKKKEFMEASPEEQLELYMNLYVVSTEFKSRVGHLFKLVSVYNNKEEIDKKEIDVLVHMGMAIIAFMDTGDYVSFLEKTFNDYFEQRPELLKNK